MADEPRLVVALEARLNKFEKDLAQAGVIADRQVRSIEDRFSRANPTFGAGFLRNLFGGALGALSLERTINAITSTLESVGKIADTAERVGLSAEQVQELRFALEQSGGSASQADSAMERFSNNVARAAQGTGFLKDLLEANNVALRDQAGQLRPTAALLQDVANLIQNARSPQERLNIATEAFGRGAGPAMAQALKDGADGLRKFGAEAQTAGAIISGDLVEQAAKLDDQWQKLMASISATIKSGVVTALPSVREFIEKEIQSIINMLVELDRLVGLIPGSDRIRTGLHSEIAGRSQLGREAGFGDIGRPSSFSESAANTGRPTISPARGGGGGGGRDAFDRQEDQIRRRIALIETETRTMGLSTEERERARIETELLTAAERAQMEVTPELRERVAALADEYGRAAARAEQARDILSATKEFGSALSEAFKSAVLEGQKLDEVLKNLINRLSSRAIDSLFNLAFNAIGSSILGGLTGPGGGVLPGGLPLGLGGIGRAASGVDNWRGGALLVGEEGPEILNLPRGSQIIPNHISRALGSSMTFAPVTTIDARGSTMGEAQFRAILAESNRQQQRQIKDQLPTWMARQQTLGKM